MLLIVRRGQAERYGYLQASFQSEPVDVIWDRRVTERRQHRDPDSVERRRHGERRAEAMTLLPSELDNRRTDDRRHHGETRIPERRHSERRGRAPVSWTALDFVFVREPAL